MTPEELEALNAQLATLSEGLTGIGERLNDFEEKIKPADPIPAPVDPAQDPDNLPPTDWKTLRTEIKTEAERIADEKLTAKEQKELEKIENQTKAEQDWNDKFDEMATTATKEGYLPEIKDTNDPNDAGNMARKDLFGFAVKLDTTDLVEVAQVVKDYNAQGKHFVIPEGKEPKDGKWIQSEYRAPGKNVPIGSSANRTSNSTTERSYKELHGSQMGELARRAKQQYGIE